MTLQLDVDVLWTEDVYQPFDNFAAGRLTAMHQRRGQGPFLTAGQAYQAGGVLLQIGKVGSAFLLGGLPHLEAGYQLTEVLIALA